MTQVQYPNRPTVRDEVQANFEAITGVVNGDLRDDNIAEKAGISGAKVDFSKTPPGSIPPSALPPANQVPAGINPNDVLVWNGSTWVGVAKAPAAVQADNANLLDGIDSSGFLQRQVAGSTERIWWAITAPFTGAVNAVQTVNHPLGRVPQVALVTPIWDTTCTITGGMTSTQVSLRWQGVTTGATASLLLIG